MRAYGVDLPDWFEAELARRSPEPTVNTVIAMLLEDYLKRNAPAEPKYDGQACDHDMIPELGCGNCDLWIKGNGGQ